MLLTTSAPTSPEILLQRLTKGLTAVEKGLALNTFASLARKGTKQKAAIREAGAIPSIVKEISDPKSVLKVECARALANLAFDCPENRLAILRARGIKPLIELLKYGDGAPPTANSSAKQMACVALGNLSVGNLEVQLEIIDANALAFIVELVWSGSSAERQAGACALEDVYRHASSAHDYPLCVSVTVSVVMNAINH